MDLLAAYAPWQLAAALGAAFGSAFVRGLTGFGMAILLVPILALALPPVEAVLLANFLSLFIGLSEVRRLVRGAVAAAIRRFCSSSDMRSHPPRVSRSSGR